MEIIEKFRQVAGESFEEDEVREKLKASGYSPGHIWAGGGKKYGIRVAMDGVMVRAFVELAGKRKTWNVSRE